MKKLWTSILATSRTAILGIIGFSLVAGLMLYRLVSLTPGLAPVEVETYYSAQSLSTIFENIVNAPYKIAIYISTGVFDSAFGLRLVGAAIGIVTIILFYLLVRNLFGNLVSLASTAMFASSSLLLGMSRIANPNVMLLSLLAVVATGAYLRFGKRPNFSWILAAIVAGLSLYVPGMIIFIVLAIIWQFKHIRQTFEEVKAPFIIAASIIFGLICAPIIVSLIRDPGIWRDFLGFNETFEPLKEMGRYTATSVLSLFVMSPIDNAYWLGRQPVLDVFATAVFVLGSYSIIKNRKLDRLWLLLGIISLSVVWIGATTNRYGIIMLLPFVYIVIASGINMLGSSWLSVFPKNPIARYAGLSLLGAAIVLSINFQLHRYFVAWPNNKSTQAVFDQHL